MSDEQLPSVDEIKSRLRSAEIPVEEETDALKGEEKTADIAAELQTLGRQVAETIQKAWHSEERQRVEKEVRVGVKSFVDEIDKVIREARESQAAARIKEEASGVKSRVEQGDLSRKARSGLVQGMQWLSEELARLADKFSPADDPTDEDEDIEIKIG
jgi:predicted NAD-dependent protein-ADP-ribosyltransferase YbiA (DUF1768 family)